MCAPIPKNKWAWKYDECVKCGTTKKTGKHIYKGRGLCHSCWDKERGKTEKRKATQKKSHDKWWNKVKGTSEQKEKANKKMREWQEKNPNTHKANWKKRNLRKRFRKYISGKLRVDKNTKNGISFKCEKCNKIITTPISAEAKNTMIRELEIFKKVHNDIFHKKL